MPLHPHAHRDLSAQRIRALVTPADPQDVTRAPNAWAAAVYADAGPALYALGTVRCWGVVGGIGRAHASCGIPGCDWQTGSATAAGAAAALAEHSGIQSGVAVEVASAWAEAMGDV